MLQHLGLYTPLDLSGTMIKKLSRRYITDLQSGYSSSTPDGDKKIYNNEEWLATANTSSIKVIPLNGHGHSTDPRLTINKVTPGDKGVIDWTLTQDGALDLEELN